MATCPECDAEIEVDEFEVDKGDQLSCDDCGSILKVVSLSPLEFDLASEDDETWTRAHFAGQPWSICAIFGLSARSDRLHDIFTQHDARLRRRGYFVIPDFKPEQWPCRGVAVRPGQEIIP